MPWKFNPFTLQLDYFKGWDSVISHDTDTVLTVNDLNKIHVMDTSGGNRTFTLPDATIGYIGYWIKMVRKGATNWLRVQASGTDVIWNSSPGGYIDTLDNLGAVDTHDYTSVNLVIADVGQWTTPEFGIWTAY
jgi:hypothetical protein